MIKSLAIFLALLIGIAKPNPAPGPERTRVFKAGTSQRTSSTRSSLKNGPVPPPRRMFSQVNWTRNHFEETLLDLADELQGEPAHKFHPNRKNDDFLLM